jgi:hypothetical protein|tara:strand:- start:37 stop:210 length:174 start_codon:yes stop_codon:yes gene_type:complete
MNGLRIHSVDNIKVKREDYESFTTITVTVTDKTDKDFELTLFTDKGFVPDMEVQDDS